MGKQWKVSDFIFWGSNSLQMVIAAMKLKDAYSLEGKLWPTRRHIEKQRHYFANKRPSSQSYGFSSSHVWMWELDNKKGWAPKNCGVGEDSWESLGLQGDPINPSQRKSVLNSHWKDWCWSWNSNTLATWCEELTHLKRPWRCERLKEGGERDDRGWDGWMASRTQWTCVWVNSGSWDGQGGLMCCSPRGHKESDMTEWLNGTDS